MIGVIFLRLISQLQFYPSGPHLIAVIRKRALEASRPRVSRHAKSAAPAVYIIFMSPRRHELRRHATEEEIDAPRTTPHVVDR